MNCYIKGIYILAKLMRFLVFELVLEVYIFYKCHTCIGQLMIEI